MNALLSKVWPSVTDVIRADHTRVLAVFHRYKANSSPSAKAARAATICTLLEAHAQAEEEVFYPAMRAAGSALVDKLDAEHDTLRGLIASLRAQEPGTAQYDETFHELIRTMVHHVADEETILLPEAERILGERLGELGARMSKRRLGLTAPHAGELAANAPQAMPGAVLMAGGAILAGALLWRRSRRRWA